MEDGLIHWEAFDSENHFFLNTKYSPRDAEVLLAVLKKAASHLKGHLFLLSSGTTGKAKWIALSKEAFLISAQAVNSHLEVGRRDRWLLTLPQFHVGGLGILARAHLSRSQVISLPKWNVSEFIGLVNDHRCTLSALVPTQIYDLVTAQMSAPDFLRAVLVGGGSLNSDLNNRAKALGWPLLATYGMTETCSQVATADLRKKALSPLPILPHWEVRISDENLLQFRGKSLLTAYVHVESDRVTFENPIDKEGWFSSQDRGKVENRMITVYGRAGEVVKIAGENTDLAKLNESLRTLKLEQKIVADIALIAIPHPRLGMQVCLVADQALTSSQAQNLIESFNGKVLPFERIRDWKNIGILPRTDLGKLISSACVQAWSRESSP